MRSIDAVLLHQDSLLAQSLQQSLAEHFRKLTVVNSAPELQAAIARLRAGFAVVDLEVVNYGELKRLCAEFPGTAFVGVHRLADEVMWSTVLQAGGVDCCTPSDVHGLIAASEKYVPATSGAAA